MYFIAAILFFTLTGFSTGEMNKVQNIPVNQTVPNVIKIIGSSPTDITVKEGETVIIYLVVNVGSCDYGVFKDTNPIEPSERQRITTTSESDSMTIMLTIKNLKMEDNGRYCIVTENEVSKVIKYFNLRVIRE